MMPETKTMRTFIVKREMWIHHAIECPERTAIYDGCVRYLKNCTTEELLELLPIIAERAEDERSLRRDPMVEYEPEPGEDVSVTCPGLVPINEPPPSEADDER